MLQNRLTSQNLVYCPLISGDSGLAIMPGSTNTPMFESARWKEHMQAVALHQDKSAYKALYLHFAPKIKSFYIQQGLDRHSEELTHEVFIKLWQKASSYDADKASVSTWLFTVVRNLRIDFLRKKRINDVSDEEFVELGEDSNLMAAVDAARNKTRLNAVFELLNEEQKNVLQKVYFEDKSHHIAAQELEMTPGVVKSRIRSALKVLRSHLEGEQ